MACSNAVSVEQYLDTPTNTTSPEPARQPKRRHIDVSEEDAALIAEEEEAHSLISLATASVAGHSDWYRHCQDNEMYITRRELVALLQKQKETAGAAVVVVVADTRDDDVAGGMIAGAVHTPDSTFGAESILKLANLAARTSNTSITSNTATSAARTATTTSTAITTPTTASSDGSIPRFIVFHCMESARRGPRCARKMTLALEALSEPEDSDEDLHAGAEVGAGAGAGAGVGMSRHPSLPPPAWLCKQLQVRVLAGGFDGWVRRYWQDVTKVENYDDEYWGYTEFNPAGEVAEEDQDEAKKLGEATAAGPAHTMYSRPADQPVTPWSAAGSGI